MRKTTLTVLALGAIALPGPPQAEEPAAQADLPADVEALIFRNASCNLAATHTDNTIKRRLTQPLASSAHRSAA